MIPSIREAFIAWLKGPAPGDEEAFMAWVSLGGGRDFFHTWADSLDA